MSAVDHYLEGVDPTARAALDRLRAFVVQMVPDAEEGTSYGMPALKYRRKPLLGFLAAKSHLSVFTFSPRVIDILRDRLNGLELSKGTIRFSAERPIPDDVLRDIVRLRLDEIDGPRREGSEQVR